MRSMMFRFNFKKKWLEEHGFTFVELIITVVISAVLMIGVSNWFGNMTKSAFKAGWDADQQRAVQTVLDLFSEDVRMGGGVVYGGGGTNGTDITIQNNDGSSNLYAYNLVGDNIRRTTFATASTVDLISQFAQNSGITVTSLTFTNVCDSMVYSIKQKVQMTMVTIIGSETSSEKNHVIEAALRNAPFSDPSALCP